MADTKIWSELRVSGEQTQTKCVLINDNNVSTLIDGLRQMSHMTSQLLTDLVEREKSSGPGEENDDDDDDDDEEEDDDDEDEELTLKLDKEPPAKKTKRLMDTWTNK